MQATNVSVTSILPRQCRQIISTIGLNIEYEHPQEMRVYFLSNESQYLATA